MRTPYSVVGFFWSMGFATAQAMTIQFPIVLNRASLPPVSNFTTVKDIAVGDLNGDLIPDIVVCGGENRVLLQSVSGYGSTSFDGHGSFSDVTPVQPPLPGVQHWGLGGEAVEVGDIDNDGDRDVVLCLNNLGFMAVPMLNDGLGLLTAGAPFNGPAGGPTGWPLVFDLRLADVDADGIVDCLLATDLGLLYFQGTGVFSGPTPVMFADVTTLRLPATAQAPCRGLDVYDEDGDGDLDIAVATLDPLASINASSVRLFRNTVTGAGSNTFVDVSPSSVAAAGLSHGLDVILGLQSGDLDQDGMPDLVVTNRPHPQAGVSPLGSNGGSFVLRRLPNGSYVRHGLGSHSYSADFRIPLCLGDLDNDCDLDIVLSTDNACVGCIYAGVTPLVALPQRTAVLINDGFGTAPWFSHQSTVRMFDDTGHYHNATQMADMDLDGDLDLLIGYSFLQQSSEQIRVVYNHMRDLDAPRSSTVGTTFVYEVSRLGSVTQVDDAVIVLLDLAAGPMVPLGALLPRPPCYGSDNVIGLTAGFLIFSSAFISIPGGPTAVVGGAPFVFTPDPSLIGLNVFAQVLHFDYGGQGWVLGPITRTQVS